MPSPAQIFDDLLVLNAQHGDKKALSLLVSRWHTKVIRQIEWRVHDHEVAQDLAQDCWITIFRKLNRLKSRQSFGPWVLKVAHNTAIDWIRRRQVEERRSQFIIESEKEASESKELLFAQMEKAIEQLDAEHKVVLRLHYLQEMSLQEIAQILELPAGTIKSRLFRARENLKKIIRKYHEY